MRRALALSSQAVSGLTARFSEVPRAVATQHLGQLQRRAGPSVGAPPRGSRAQLSDPGDSSPRTAAPGRAPAGPPPPVSESSGKCWRRGAAHAAGPSALRGPAGGGRGVTAGPRAFLPVRTTPDRRAASVRQKGVPRPLGLWVKTAAGQVPKSCFSHLIFGSALKELTIPGGGRVSLGSSSGSVRRSL